MGNCMSGDAEGHLHLEAFRKLPDGEHRQRFADSLNAVQFGKNKLKLYLKIVECVNLKWEDPNGYSDPYVKVKVDEAVEAKEATKKKYKTLYPVYNHDMTFTLNNGELKGDIHLIPTDYDPDSANDTLGYAVLPLEMLRKDKYFYGWVNLFEDEKAAYKSKAPGMIYIRMCLGSDIEKEDLAAALALHRVYMQEVEDMKKNVDRFVNLRRKKVDEKGYCALASGGPFESVGTVKVHCCTWNVGNKHPGAPEELRNWLTPGADIYAIGTQENLYNQRAEFGSHEEDWIATVQATLGPDYFLLCKENIGLGGQIWIHLFVKESLRQDVDNLQMLKGSESTGIGGVVNNKGGVSVAISVKGTTIAFISSHLAAHTTFNDRRNEDFSEIIKGLQYAGTRQHSNFVDAFHHSFWMGDLNYRVLCCGDKTKPDEQKFNEMVKELFDPNEDKDKLLEKYMENDQLKQSIASKEGFWRFNDSWVPEKPFFRPSFKVSRGKVEPEYDPHRAPSYCDRVLWYSQKGFEKDVVCKTFTSAEKVITGDHKPVFGEYEIKTRQYAPCIDEKRGEFRMDILALRATGLPAADIGGTSDPYVQLHSPYLVNGTPWQTEYKPATLNPQWLKAELPQVIFPFLNNKERLSQELLFINVYDYDAVGADDLISSGTLAICDLLEAGAAKKAIDIEVALHAGGKPAGTLFAKIKLSWQVEAAEEEAESINLSVK